MPPKPHALLCPDPLDTQGLDKMILDNTGEITITNDGATILQLLEVELGGKIWPMARDGRGYTFVHLAAKSGDVPTLRWVVERCIAATASLEACSRPEAEAAVAHA